MQSVVLIEVDRIYRNQLVPTSGTGFFVDSSGMVVTNWHVVAPQLEINLYGQSTELSTSTGPLKVVIASGTPGARSLQARIVRLDREQDLALIWIDYRSSAWLEPAASAPRILDSIWAVGYPFGDYLAANRSKPEVTVTAGRVTSIRHDEKGTESAVQIDAAINPGNSGGPIVDSAGRVLGVIQSAISGADSTSFAIPLAAMKKFMADCQYRISFTPAAVYSRTEPITVKVEPLMRSLEGKRCGYVLSGEDITTLSGELQASGGSCTGQVIVPAAQEKGSKRGAYLVRLVVSDAGHKDVFERTYALPLREGEVPMARSQRTPADMMRDRREAGNRTGSGDPGVNYGKGVPVMTDRTGLSELAKNLKLNRDPESEATITGADLSSCSTPPREETFALLDDPDLIRLARKYAETECVISEAQREIENRSKPKPRDDSIPYYTYEGAIVYAYGRLRATPVPTPPAEQRIVAARQTQYQLRRAAQEAGLCRCPDGVWSTKTAPPRCSRCEVPGAEED